MNIELRWLKPHPKSHEPAILQYRHTVNIHVESTNWREGWTGWKTVETMSDEKAYAAWKDQEPVL